MDGENNGSVTDQHRRAQHRPRKVKVKAIDDSVKSIHVLGDLDDDLRPGLAFAQVRCPAWETVEMYEDLGMMSFNGQEEVSLRFEVWSERFRKIHVCCFTIMLATRSSQMLYLVIA